MSVEAGLEVPQFREHTMRELSRIVPTAGTSIRNPLDAWPIYHSSQTLGEAIRIVARDENIHSLALDIHGLAFRKREWGDAFDPTLTVMKLKRGVFHYEVLSAQAKPVAVEP